MVIAQLDSDQRQSKFVFSAHGHRVNRSNVLWAKTFIPISFLRSTIQAATCRWLQLRTQIL